MNNRFGDLRPDDLTGKSRQAAIIVHGFDPIAWTGKSHGLRIFLGHDNGVDEQVGCDLPTTLTLPGRTRRLTSM